MAAKERIQKVETLMWMRCNCNCIFCSLGDKIRIARTDKGYCTKPTDQIMEDIDYAASINAQTFSFSGGEPTLRKDLPFLIRYAKSKGIERIQVQSNGRRFYYEKYCRLLAEAGANEFAISFHSPKEDIEDMMMGAKGSYRQALAGIRNIIKLDREVKVSIVITKLNYKDMPELTKMLLGMGVSEIRYDFVTIEGFAKNNPATIVPKMSDVVPYLLECLDMHNPNGAWMAVFNIPYCLLPGHFKHVVDMTQPATQLRGSDFIISIKDNRKRDKIKLDKCSSCAFDRICFGVWENYADIYGTGEIRPVKRRGSNG